MGSPILETHIPSDMCSHTWETLIPSDMWSLTWETHIPVICVSPPGKHVSLVIMFLYLGKMMTLSLGNETLGMERSVQIFFFLNQNNRRLEMFPSQCPLHHNFRSLAGKHVMANSFPVIIASGRQSAHVHPLIRMIFFAVQLSE